MTTVAILPVPTEKGGLSYRGVAGDKWSQGSTPGEALDALATQLGDDGTNLFVVVQSLRPDRFFNADQQQRLSELMEQWRTAQDLNESFRRDRRPNLMRSSKRNCGHPQTAPARSPPHCPSEPTALTASHYASAMAIAANDCRAPPEVVSYNGIHLSEVENRSERGLPCRGQCRDAIWLLPAVLWQCRSESTASVHGGKDHPDTSFCSPLVPSARRSVGGQLSRGCRKQR